jgi:enoyl-CoA hydratase
MSDDDAASPLLVRRSDEGFATLVLNRPDKLNALSIALRRALAEAVEALEADPAVRVLILTGAGRVFTAGLDLDEWSAGGVRAAAAYEHDAVAALRRFSGPLIGAINGATITGGLEVALACDLLVAASDARFADTHARVGLLPGWGGSVRLIERIGLARAKELAFTGRFVEADEALALGLVNRVVPPERLLPEAEAMARRMLAAEPSTLAAYKRLFDAQAGASQAEALRIERAASIAHNVPVPHDAIAARLRALRARKGS